MFETVDNAEVSIPAELKDFDERAWWYVTYRLHMRWFHVTCEFNYKDGQATHMLFLTQLEHLLDIEKEKSIKILQIDLVTPGHMNDGERWQMEPLSEIWIGYEPDTEHRQEAQIYVVADGSHYIDSALETNEEELLDKRKIFAHI